jgi:pyrrolidone-carboxylate peptidase
LINNQGNFPDDNLSNYHRNIIKTKVTMFRNKLVLKIALLLCSSSVYANQISLEKLSVEELRLEKAAIEMPDVINAYASNIKSFKRAWETATSYQIAKETIISHAQQLWLDATKRVQHSSTFDDRPLYWARLSMSKIIRETPLSLSPSKPQLKALITLFEHSSRGRMDLEYTKSTDKKILLTGFDPFLLDKNINQSNPSGIAALRLDGQVITYKGITAEINTVMIPVRYQDFDEGIIETLLTPYYALNNVDMIVTVSMGRKEFDLERFPGKRRSVTAPDNLNVFSGGSEQKPIIPKLHNNLLPGEEFVLFSLPVTQMQKVEGPYKIIDNHKITSIGKSLKPKSFEPDTLSQLNGHVAVSGSGGGYLSNEISYRSIRLKEQLNSTIPTGHIHTPRIQQFEPDIEEKIVKQIQSMLEVSLEVI